MALDRSERAWQLAALAAGAVCAWLGFAPARSRADAAPPTRIAARAARPAALAATVSLERVEPVPDRVRERLAITRVGTEQCQLLSELAPSSDPANTYAIAAVLDRARLSSVRRCAADALAVQPTPEAESWLISISDDDDAAVRDSALSALAARADLLALHTVRSAARAGDLGLRSSAVRALLQARRADALPDAVALAALLEDQDELTALILALGKLRDARALPLLQRLLAEGTTSTHLAAIDAIGGLGNPDGIALLAPLLEVGSTGELAAAARALLALEGGAVRVRLEPIAAASDARRRAVIAPLLDRVAPRDAEPSEPEVEASAEPTLTREQARAQDLALLAQGGEAAHEALRRLAADPSEVAVSAVVDYLGRERPAAAFFSEVLQQAPERTRATVLAQLSASGEPELEQVALRAAAEQARPESRALLLRASRDADSTTRELALRGLANLGAGELPGLLSELARSSQDSERTFAVSVLATRADVQATFELEHVADDPAIDVAVEALKALRARAPEAVADRLRERFARGPVDERAALIDVASGLGARLALPVYDAALASGGDAADAAVTQLGALGGPDVADRLARVARDESRPLDLRQSAARALRVLGGPLAQAHARLLGALLSDEPEPVPVCSFP